MSLKLKWFLVWLGTSAMPFLVGVCGPWIGLAPKHGMRWLQLVTGFGAPLALAAWNVIAYRSEKNFRERITRLRRMPR